MTTQQPKTLLTNKGYSIRKSEMTTNEKKKD